MLKALKRAEILLAFIISLSVPALSGYLIYCDIAFDDPFSIDLQYENDDIDDFFLIPKYEHQFSMGSIELVIFSLPEISGFEQVFFFCPTSLCTQQKTIVLRS
jgi:hypothetical protein